MQPVTEISSHRDVRTTRTSINNNRINTNSLQKQANDIMFKRVIESPNDSQQAINQT
jgi:hypothetical protein